MANHKSALKRIKQNEIRRIRNKSVKTRIKTAAKNVILSLSNASDETPAQTLNKAKSSIDKAAKKGVIHKNTASRKISRLSKKVKAASA